MSLPVGNNLLPLDYALAGLPFCDVNISSVADLGTLDVAYQGLPFAPPQGIDPPIIVAAYGIGLLSRSHRAGGKGVKLTHLP